MEQENQEQNAQQAQFSNNGGAPYKSEKKVVAGILGILLGGLAIHKFYLGPKYQKTAIIQLIIGIVTCGAGGIIGFIEGIIYLTKSDEEFDQTYVQGTKEWF